MMIYDRLLHTSHLSDNETTVAQYLYHYKGQVTPPHCCRHCACDFYLCLNRRPFSSKAWLQRLVRSQRGFANRKKLHGELY